MMKKTLLVCVALLSLSGCMELKAPVFIKQQTL